MPDIVTFHQFNTLSNNEKYELVDSHGECLNVSRMSGIYQVALFSLFGFYVEVWFNRPEDKLLKASAFKSYKKLDPYLKEISLKAIIG